LIETLCRSYAVAGQSVTFACADEWTAEKAARHVAGWHFAELADDPPSAFVIRLARVSVSSAPSAPPRERPPGSSSTGNARTAWERPQGPPAFAVHHGECFQDGDSFSLSTSDSWVRVHPPETRLVEAWIGAKTAASSTALARLLFYATQAALRRCGLYEIHAAAATHPERQHGVLVIGASGSGKTTLAMRLTAAGWSNVADDLVLIREGPAAVEAFAFRRVFAATQTTLDACPTPRLEEATREPNEFEPSKRRLDPEVLFPGRFTSSCTPRVLVFPSITGEPRTEARPVSTIDALTRLLKMCPWASYDTPVARPHLSALGRLAGQCASYELLAGNDLLDDPQAAPRLFDSLPAGAP
jgi:hypothetical protein